MKTEITIDAEIFTSLINKLENTKPAFDDFGRTASQFLIPEKFNRSEDAYGNKWQPLAPRTLNSKYKGKIRSAWGSKPLNASGVLKKSFKFRSTSDSVEIYTDEDYFKYHQSTEPRTRLPRRPALPDKDKGLPKVWTDALINALEKHL